MRNEAFVGTPDRVIAAIAALAARLNVQEIAIVTWTYDEAARRKSYDLLARAANLAARPLLA